MQKKEKNKQLSNLKQYIYANQNKILNCNLSKFQQASKQHIEEFGKIEDENTLKLLCQHLKYMIQAYSTISDLTYVPVLFFVTDKSTSKQLYDMDEDYNNIPF